MPADCIYKPGEGRDEQENYCLCQHFFMREICPSSPGPEARQLSLTPYVSDASRAAALALEHRASESSVNKFVYRPFKRNNSFPLSNSTIVSTGFHSQRL